MEVDLVQEMTSIKIQRIAFHLLLVAVHCALIESTTVTIICTENHLLVTGDLISIDDARKSAPCWSKSGKIDIFALNKVVLDTEINEHDRNVTITTFSPKWEILPLTKISRGYDYFVYKEPRFIYFNDSADFNLFCMTMDKINGKYLRLQSTTWRNRPTLQIINGK